jgi:hypothetical protein
MKKNQSNENLIPIHKKMPWIFYSYVPMKSSFCKIKPLRINHWLVFRKNFQIEFFSPGSGSLSTRVSSTPALPWFSIGNFFWHRKIVSTDLTLKSVYNESCLTWLRLGFAIKLTKFQINVVNMAIVFNRLMSSVWFCTKVITLRGFHCIKKIEKFLFSENDF